MPRGPVAVVLVLVACLLGAGESRAAPPSPSAPPLDRIVAVVDQHPITRSELRARARPRLRQMASQTGKRPDAAAVEALYAELLQHVIDERLIASDAEARYITATAEDVDRAVEQLAASNKITTAELFAEVERVGMTHDEYREELRRQIVDGKWTMLVVRSTVTVSKSDEKAYWKATEEARAKALERLRAAHYVEVRK